MLRNFFITSFRNLTRNKTYLTLGVLGLALGMSCVISLYTIINFQTNFDVHQENYDQIYRVIGDINTRDYTGKTATVPHLLSDAIRDELSNVDAISNTFLLSDQVNVTDSKGKLKKIIVDRIAFGQKGLFDIISFDWLAGNPDNFDVKSVYLSSSTAQVLFDAETDFQSIIGKTVVLANKHNLQVAGVYADFPKRTDFPFEMLTAYTNQEGVNPYYTATQWGRLNGGTMCFLKTTDGSNMTDVQNSVRAAFEKHNVIEGYKLELQSLKELHRADVRTYSGVGFQENYEILSYTLAFFLALIGAINFINLTTARAVKRAKEVGIRKVMGSQRIDLIFQFMLESFIIVSISLFLGFVMADQIMYLFEELTSMSMTIQDVSIMDWTKFSLVTLLGMTFLSGFYPALVLSKFSSLEAIKTKISNIDRQSRVPLRKILVGLQFGFSVVLIIATLVIFYQMEYMKGYDMGFKKDGIITLNFPKPDAEKQRRLVTRLQSLPQFEKMSLQLGGPIASTNNTDKYFNPILGEDYKVTVNTKSIDENYLDLYGLELISGRNITPNDPHDNVLVSELAIKEFALETPEQAIGQVLESSWGAKRKIVGVVKDFNSRSLSSSMEPVMLGYNKGGFYELGIEFSAAGKADIANSIKVLEATWDEVYPELLIEYSFLDERIANAYKFQDVMAKSTTFFVIITLIISILGLYGLTDFMANAKRKEIGIRKVVGANIGQIINIFFKEVFVILMIAFTISSTLSYTLMNKWLEGFEYRVPIGWEIITIAFVSTLTIAFLTMGYRSYTAANINPVSVLKDE